MYDLGQFVITTVAVTGVILNNHRLRLCFVLWIFSNAATSLYHLEAGQWGLLARDLIFLILALHGWYKWGKSHKSN